MGNVGGLFNVTGQSDYPRSVVNLEQIMDAPSNEDVRTLVESAREEALMERRCWNLAVDREPFIFLDWRTSRLACAWIALTSHGYHTTESHCFPTC